MGPANHQVFALFLLHYALECGFGLVARSRHDDFVVLPGQEIEHDLQHRWVAGTQDGLGIASAVLKLQSDQHRFLGFLQRGDHLGDAARRQRQSGRHKAAELQKASAIDSFLEQGPGQRIVRREHGLTSRLSLCQGSGHRKNGVEVFFPGCISGLNNIHVTAMQ